jgi:hypothetical protein
LLRLPQYDPPVSRTKCQVKCDTGFAAKGEIAYYCAAGSWQDGAPQHGARNLGQ